VRESPRLEWLGRLSTTTPHHVFENGDIFISTNQKSHSPKHIVSKTLLGSTSRSFSIRVPIYVWKNDFESELELESSLPEAPSRASAIIGGRIFTSHVSSLALYSRLRPPKQAALRAARFSNSFATSRQIKSNKDQFLTL
jgi:hypothetical protein